MGVIDGLLKEASGDTELSDSMVSVSACEIKVGMVFLYRGIAYLVMETRQAGDSQPEVVYAVTINETVAGEWFMEPSYDVVAISAIHDCFLVSTNTLQVGDHVIDKDGIRLTYTEDSQYTVNSVRRLLIEETGQTRNLYGQFAIKVVY